MDEKWLQERIEEDLIAMADEREKQLMEMPELQNIHMPKDKLADIYKAAEKYKDAEKCRDAAKKKVRIRYRMVAVLAAALVLCIGAGMLSSGNKVYIPKIMQSSRGDETQTKVENSDSTYREYDEEEVCQEIEDKLGVLPVRFAYRSEEMYLCEYRISENVNEAIVKYKLGENELQIYISKDYEDTTINYQTDGEKLETLAIESCGLEVPVFKYQDSDGKTYFEADFEYLNTYYSIGGMIGQEEYIKILENIWIKNV